MRAALVAALTLVAPSCHRPPPPTNPHYILGAPYQVGGVWYYPRERYELQETGLATVYPSGHAELTADGEAFDQTALAAAHQTLQLPAIARVTNLKNGRQVQVRINDRGPATPHRLIEVTRRTAVLLDFPADGVARVRVEVQPTESYAAVDGVQGAPRLELSTAPLGAVQQSELPPPGGVTPVIAAASAPLQPPAEAAATTDPRLPEAVTQESPEPGNLFVQLGTFQTFAYADIQRARVAALGARIVSTREGRVQTHRVIIGPFTSVQQADTVLDQVVLAGVTDSRIVVQ
jgi:peptidoglycan lytic transglycosylase